MDEAVRTFVLLRDGGCVARYVNSSFWASRFPMLQDLPAPGQCSGMFGSYDDPNSLLHKELDHVERADELSFATKPPDDPEHLWTLCHGHHQERRAGRVWATHEKVRGAAREYIVEANAAAKKRGFPPYPVPSLQED